MITVEFASPQDREEIAAFMAEVFPRAKWGMTEWRRLLDGRWAGADLPYAVTARDAGRLVGVMGLVTAQRETEAGPALTANMSSWYILAPYRGQGLGGRMIACAKSLPDVTITDLTSSKLAVGAVQRAGLVPLDTHRCLWTPRSAEQMLPMHPAEQRAADLPAAAQRIVADLAGLPQDRVVIDTPDGPLLVVRAIKRKHASHLTHDVLHLWPRARFAAHARAVADTLLGDTQAELSVDRRFAPGVTPDRIEEIPVPRFYTPGQMAPADVDHLYSEVMLLDMKLD